MQQCARCVAFVNRLSHFWLMLMCGVSSYNDATPASNLMNMKKMEL